jgi:hypothetical protein
MTDVSGEQRDFFVSFNRADRAWAAWIAWALEEAGYSVFFQDWDFKGNFVLEMDKAHTQSRRTIAVLSPDYLTSRFTAPEWAARFAEDATSEHDLLIPVRVRPCELQGLLAQIVYLDLVGCGEEAARDKLLGRVEGIRLKPDEPPLFPGQVSHDVVPERPVFPAPGPQSGGSLTRSNVAPTADRGALPAPWLIGVLALAALAVMILGLVASGGRNVTATGGSTAVGGDITNSHIVNGGATKP